MIEVHRDEGQSRVRPCRCDSGKQLRRGDGEGQPSFGQLFELHRALEETISAAVRDGSAICPALILETLSSKSAEAGISAAELHKAIIHAAARAGVSVRTADASQAGRRNSN